MHSSKTAATAASPPEQDPILPQLIILGAQKSGTTALATYLGQHPRLLHPKRKEVNFFGSDPRYLQGLDWYAAQWPRAKNAIFGRLALFPRGNEIRFEASPHYLRSQHAAVRIHDCLPAVRLIAILRDPVERAYSAWQMYRKQLAGNPAFYDAWNRRIFFPEVVAALEPREPAELEDFELAIRLEADCLARGKSKVWSLLEYGFYGEQLARYLRHFPRQQLLILHNRDLMNRTVPTLNRVLQFIDLAMWDWSKIDLSPVHTNGNSAPIPAHAAAFLREFYAASDRQLAKFGFELPYGLAAA